MTTPRRDEHATILLRGAWILTGVVGVLLHRPFGPVLLAIAIPWVVVLILLSRSSLANRFVGAWREALNTRTGAAGAAGLGLAVLGVVIAVSGAAGAHAGIWVVAAASLVGVLRGADHLKEQLAGWSLLAIACGIGLITAETALRRPSVAGRLGTPREYMSWWQRYDGSWNHNALGIRSPYETLSKEPNAFRVVAIGDSFTWGSRIASSDSTWPAQLEVVLRERGAGRNIEVVNLGRIGFSTVNSASMLRRLGWQFDPDIVVAQFYVNDILPSGPDFITGETSWIFPRVRLLPERYRNGPAGTSSLLHVLEETLSGLRHGDRAAQAAKWTAVYQRKGPEWLAMLAALNEMGEAAAARDVPIVLMLYPDFIPGIHAGADPPFQSIHEQVATAASAAGFSILDLTPHYLREGGDLRRWWATPYDAHPNAAANGLAARTLADFLTAHRPQQLDTQSESR
jgi:lysophospholipase L1-like esterase